MVIKIKNIVIKDDKLLSIELLRFFASFSVLFYHYGFYRLFQKYKIVFLDFISPFGSTYAVPLFFVISGFCIHWSNRFLLKKKEPLPVVKYFKRRLYRIYPPYLFALLLSIGINSLSNQTLGIHDFILKLFLVHIYDANYFNTINLVLWTIAVEVCFYIIYPIFYKIRVKNGLNTSIIIVFILSMVSILLLDKLGISSLSGRWFFLNFWFIWCIGAAIADIIITKQNIFEINTRHIITIAFMSFTLLIVFFYLNNIFYFKDQLHCLICLLPLIIFLNFEKYLNEYKVKLFLFTALGSASYSIYLLHEPFITFKNILFKLFNFSGNIYLHALAFPFILYFCYLGYKFVELPYIEYGKRK